MRHRIQRGAWAVILGCGALLSACHGVNGLTQSPVQQVEITPAQHVSQPNPSGQSQLAWAGTYPREPDLVVAHVNDVHSHLDARPLTLNLASQRVAVEVGGMPRVSQAIRQLQQQAPGRVLALHAGDAITGDLYFNQFRGAADARLMGEVCFDAFTLGNHEFDHGDAALKGFLTDLSAEECAPRVLSANVRFGPESPLRPWQEQGRIAAAAVFERGGKRVGVVGLTVADKTLRSSRPDPGTNFLDELALAQAVVDALREQGVSRVIVLSHIGYQRDMDLASALRGVDVVVGGDSHSLLGPEELRQVGLNPVGPYPSRTQNADGDPVCVVQAAHHALVLGRLAIWFDEQGRVEHCAGMPLIPLAASPSTEHWPQTPLFKTVFEVLEPSASAEATLAPYAQARAELGQRVVAQVPANWCMQRLPTLPGYERADGQSITGACQASPYAARHGGEVAHWTAHAVAQAFRPYLDAQFLLLNVGSIRHDLAAGELKVADLYSLLPFDNALVMLTLQGSEVLALLESQLDQVLTGQSSGRYLVGSGIRWWYSTALPNGQRVLKVEVQQADGSFAAIDPTAFYSVATTDFVADGGDGYDLLRVLPSERRVDVGLPLVPLLLDWLSRDDGTVPTLQLPAQEVFSTQAIQG